MKRSDNEIIFTYLLNRLGQYINGADLSKDLNPEAVAWAYRSRISDIKRMLEKNPESLYKIESRRGANGLFDYRMTRIDHVQPSIAYEGDQAVMGI